ncbi:hypothetical protein EDD16DRAFT_1637350 [Pisolithus croceorrhizus]|nr:hypothetical protein EDD16DRAFT_1637350 [Pisolithus croceorrhizus]
MIFNAGASCLPLHIVFHLLVILSSVQPSRTSIGSLKHQNLRACPVWPKQPCTSSTYPTRKRDVQTSTFIVEIVAVVVSAGKINDIHDTRGF